MSAPAAREGDGRLATVGSETCGGGSGGDREDGEAAACAVSRDQADQAAKALPEVRKTETASSSDVHRGAVELQAIIVPEQVARKPEQIRPTRNRGAQAQAGEAAPARRTSGAMP